MNDNIIINIISKTYFTIISFFIFIFAVLSIIFIILQNGLFINELTISNIHIKQLYIKWNERIDISLEEIEIQENNSTATEFDTSKIHQYFTSLATTKEWFDSFVVEKIIYKDIVGSFKYKIGESGFFIAHSPSLDIDTKVDLSPQSIQLTLNSFKDDKHKINVDGFLYFDTRTNILCADLNAKLSDVTDFTIYTVISKEKLFYKLKSNKTIKDLEYLINLANLPNAVRYWAYDAIGMSYATLHDITGYIDYNDMQNAYKNIHIQATLYNASYIYNPKLDAIHCKKIELEFKKGLFYIRPIEAYSYGMDLGKSWVLIDFTAKKEVLLTLSLLFDAKLNKSVLKILEAYKIKLPFLQNSGNVATDLKIEIGLETISVNAKGTFFTKKANFDYLGLNVDINNARILLDNYDVSIKDMNASYQDIAKAVVDVNYNAKRAEGKIDFKLNSFNLHDITLAKESQALNIIYNISPNKDTITLADSKLNYKGQTISIDSVVLPFNLETLDLSIPATLITLDGMGNAFISGKANIKSFITDLDIDLLNFNYDGFELAQSNTPLHLHYENKLNITSDKPIYLDVSGSRYQFDNFFLELKNNELYLKHTLVHIGKYIEMKIYAKHNLKTNKAHASLSNFILKDPNTEKVLYKKNKILLSSKIVDRTLQISSPEIASTFIAQDTGWRLNVNSISRVSTNSDLLKELYITNGEFILFKNKNDKYTRFKAKLKYPYKILLNNGKPTDLYTVKGKIYKEKVYLNINDKLFFTIKEDMRLRMNNSSVNVIALLDAIENFSEEKDENDKSMNITVEAKNSTLYVSKDRSILYDTLNLQYYNNILTAQLKYDQGSAGLKLEEKTFHLYGKKFNDHFMNKLFSLSKFYDGSLDFSLDGTLSDYAGVIYVRKTTMKDYAILNNMLAFINTIPSLATFSLPGYNKNGLFVKHAFVHFKSKNKNLNLEDIYLDSKEMKVVGKGKIDFLNDSMDITLNLKSDLGSDLAKVPLLGYAILGQDTISTTLKVSGKIENPTIRSMVAKDIVVAPLNIIKRTLTLPYKLIHDVIDNKKKTK